VMGAPIRTRVQGCGDWRGLKCRGAVSPMARHFKGFCDGMLTAE
jgi:hypothetical protein